MSNQKTIFRNTWLILFILLGLPVILCAQTDMTGKMDLNGVWDMGFSRSYTAVAMVPSIANDPSVMSDNKLWYRKEIILPEGKWKKATLELKGARFLPEVYINGLFEAGQNGGMAPLFFHLNNKEVRPGNKITIEIALASLKNVPPTDASYIPVADQWRTNISSCLWDDVVLHLHGEVSIERVIPFIDYKSRKLELRFEMNAPGNFKGRATIDIIDSDGKQQLTATVPVTGSNGSATLDLGSRLMDWSPDDPNLYKLRLTIADKHKKICDQSAISLGIKNFEIRGKRFYLNGNPFVPKGPTVVWHRWMRTDEGRALGYDTLWFVRNIIRRTRDLGGNYLRFHLGLPPERFLDLCDRYGLVVQYEWSFFHGMPASKESLVEQYKNWLDLAMRHPSVALIHPYNETEGDQLDTVWEALGELLPDYPPLVLEERDVLHIHKYWWSLFENLGLYYDSAAVFPKTIMVDEFGGNYLDENGNMGDYPSVKETFLRFLGRSNTAEERLRFQAQANSKIAEYWRRIGAAGISPFCALGSKQDGNTWFMGKLKEGNPKPVWEELAAAFSPQSVSIELWDRNFVPGQKLTLPIYLFNEKISNALLNVSITVEESSGKVSYNKDITTDVPASSTRIEYIDLQLPSLPGDYIIKAEILNKPENIRYRVVSEWPVRIMKAMVPADIINITVGVPEYETELIQFLKQYEIKTTDFDDNSAIAIITSLKTWNLLAGGDTALAVKLQSAIMSGKGVVMLDIGERNLGQGYPEKSGDLGPLQGVARVSNPKVNYYNLFAGIRLKFTEMAEPESHLHPDRFNRDLWYNLNDDNTRLWNGYRGGLIVPATDMELTGLNTNAFISQWQSRGAIDEKIKRGPYYTYELQGFYEFSDKPDDIEVLTRIKEKVKQLVQDAPALAVSVNPLTPVKISNLHEAYLNSAGGIARRFIPLASCGKNLTRTPAALIGFAEGQGNLLVSQLLTAGRLVRDAGEKDLYGIRYDEAAAQFVLNMISLSIKLKTSNVELK